MSEYEGRLKLDSDISNNRKSFQENEAFSPIQAGQLGARTESHTVYELKSQREYHIRKIVDIQAAIDAVNKL